MNTVSLQYRGFIQGLFAQQSLAVFATLHSEDQPGALYRISFEKDVPTLTEAKLACGVTAITRDEKNTYIAGDNGQLYKAEFLKGKPLAVKSCQWEQEDKVHSLAVLSDRCIALLHDKRLDIQSLSDENPEYSFQLDDHTTCMACSPDGLWLAVGDKNGQIYVYENFEGTWQLSNQAKIHKGKVTSIQFEKDELRFYSAGEDKKLFSTHAQGTLEPLDKGRSSNHEGTIQSILLGTERFFTAADDKTIKAWPFAGGQPVTLKEGLKKAKYLSQVEYLGKPHLIVSDNYQSLTLISLTPDDKFSEVRTIIHDGYAWAKNKLSNNQASERDQGIDLLTQYDDKKSLDLLNKHFKIETSKETRLAITKAFTGSKHHFANTLLLEMLADKKHSEVRTSALAALQKRLEKTDLQAYEKALSTDHIDISLAAVQALSSLAKKDHHAKAILVGSLQHNQTDVAKHALDLLEKLFDKKSPKASLLALKSRHTNVARAALIRLYQRKLLGLFDVKRTLLLVQNHEDEQLRQTALLVSILGQTKLVKALKTRDQQLARSLQEIEDFELFALDKVSDKNEKEQSESDKNQEKMPKPSSIKSLDSEDYRVLLQGMSNPHADVSFTAAFSLATLKDQRAFGLLVLLSQEPNTSIRIGVCNAFAWLKQPESIEQLRLMLNDKKPSVRDRAFSALLEIVPKSGGVQNSLNVAEFGFESSFQDVHERSLKTLLDSFSVSHKAKEPIQLEALELLGKALNNAFEAIRQEAFKATLNRKLGGDEEATLALLLKSQHESVHLDVLNELKAKSEDLLAMNWVQPCLFALLNDQYQGVRKATFEFMSVHKKRFDLQEALSISVNSTYLDTRKMAHEYLVKHPSKAHQLHLQTLVTDENSDLRIQALQALVLAENESAISAALTCDYDDVKVNAAVALANWGNEEAFQPLMDFLAHPKPTEKALVDQWNYTIQHALLGVGRLGDSRACDVVLSYLGHENSEFVMLAAQVLPWVTQNATSEIKSQLTVLLQDERLVVQSHACLALSLLGDDQARSTLTNIEEKNGLNTYELMGAKAAINIITPVSLQDALENSYTQSSALIALFAFELLNHSDSPYLSTWALSLNEPEVQYLSAKLLSLYDDVDARWEVLRSYLIKTHLKEGAKSWDISIETLMNISVVLVHGDGHSKARTAKLLQCFDDRLPYKQWLLHYDKWQVQHQSLIGTLQSKKGKEPTIKQKLVWQQRAFGAYLGLIRQESDYSSNMQLRALNALIALAKNVPELTESAESCLMALLNNHHYVLRHKAFEELQALGSDIQRLGDAATTSPQADIAKKGLLLLIEHYPVGKSKTLLEEMIGSDDMTLSNEAYQLYRDDQGLLAVAPFALESQNTELRSQVIDDLAIQYNDEKVQQLLVGACQNSQSNIAIKSMEYLAKHQHPEAFNLNSKRLSTESNTKSQSLLIYALQLIKTENVAIFLLDYLLNNPLCQYNETKLLNIIANYRSRKTFATISIYLKSATSRSAVNFYKSLHVITGFDQYIEDFNEKTNDRSWIEKKYPFHEDLLLQLFQLLLDQKHHKEAANYWKGLAWMKDTQADQALADASNVIQTEYLHYIIEALAYRLKRRNGPAESLVRLLEHKDSRIQFLAAEKLALNNVSQGFNVLFAAIDYQEEDSLRQRAVLALGHLADERSLDKLLTLAEDKEHFLNNVAIEAIGHMGDSEQSEKIFQLITSTFEQASTYSESAKHAIKGLRYLNTLEAWQYLLIHISDHNGDWTTREYALLQLKHWDTEASRDCVLKQLGENDDPDIAKAAFITARNYWPLEKKKIDEVDIALTRSEFTYLDRDLFERLGKYATSQQLLMLLSTDYAGGEESINEVLPVLVQALQKHDDLSDNDLMSAVQVKPTSVLSIVCRLLNKQAKLSKALGTSLSERTKEYLHLWKKDSHKSEQEPYYHDERLQATQSCLLALLSTQVLHDVYDETLCELLVSEVKQERIFQGQILQGLNAKNKLKDKAILASLKTLRQSSLSGVRATAEQLLAKHTKSANDLSWQSFVSQPQELLNNQYAADIQAAASNQAHQAQVLPTLIQKEDSKTLYDIACNETLKENLRLGAIEGLACILTNEANEALTNVHKATKDKGLAKQAYRALRRQQRSLDKKLAKHKQTAGA